MELKDTIEMMTSPDYKERFKAEYYQTQIRCNKLQRMIDDFYIGELPFTLNSPMQLLYKQIYAMQEYLDFLIIRAKIEEIELEDA